MRRELDAIEDESEREVAFNAMVQRMYAVGKAVNVATHFEIDDVIDPAHSRRWVTTILLNASQPGAPRHGKKRSFVDTW